VLGHWNHFWGLPWGYLVIGTLPFSQAPKMRSIVGVISWGSRRGLGRMEITLFFKILNKIKKNYNRFQVKIGSKHRERSRISRHKVQTFKSVVYYSGIGGAGAGAPAPRAAKRATASWL